MSDTTTPYVSDEQIMEMSLVYQSNVGEDDGSPMSTTMRNSASLLHMRDLYELHVQQLVRERDEALAKVSEFQALANEVVKVWNEDGEFGEIQKKTPIAWYRVLRLAESLTTHKTPPSNG